MVLGFSISELCMRTPHRHITILALLLLVSLESCDKTDLGVIDSRGTPPALSGAAIAPDSINLETLTPSNGTYTLSITTSVHVTDQGSTGSLTVSAEAFTPTGSSPIAVASLADNGTAPDAKAGDGTYSGSLVVPAVRADAGVFRVRFRAISTSGYESNNLERPLVVTRRNSPPGIFNLVAPDSVVLPTGSTLLIPMYVSASDSDGLTDIREVFFKSLDSSDPTRKFFLLDDGNTSVSGDRLAGDGIFSIVIQLPDFPGVRRTYRFMFQANDSFADTSGTILHLLTVE
jgi:hypothetical protein